VYISPHTFKDYHWNMLRVWWRFKCLGCKWRYHEFNGWNSYLCTFYIQTMQNHIIFWTYESSKYMIVQRHLLELILNVLVELICNHIWNSSTTPFTCWITAFIFSNFFSWFAHASYKHYDLKKCTKPPTDNHSKICSTCLHKMNIPSYD